MTAENINTPHTNIHGTDLPPPIFVPRILEDPTNLEMTQAPQHNIAHDDISWKNLHKRMWNTFKTPFSECAEKDITARERIKRVGSFAVASIAQSAQIGRAMIWVLPPVLDRAIEYSQENELNQFQASGLGAIAVGTAFAAYSTLIGRGFHNGINNLPRTVGAVKENHPVFLEVLSGAVSGFPKSEEEYDSIQPIEPEKEYTFGPYATEPTLAGKAKLAAGRGASTLFIFGVIPHVGLSKVNGFNDEAIHNRRRVTTAEGTVVASGVASGLTALVWNNFMGIAEQVRDNITDSKNLLITTGLLIAYSATDNLRQRRKLLKNAALDEDVDPA